MPRGRIDQRYKHDPAAAPTAAGVLSRLAAGRAIQAGVRIEPLLQETDLPATLMEEADVRVSARGQVDFLNLVAQALQDRFLGFHLARDIDLREFGSFYYVLASSDRLGDSVNRAVRYSVIIDEAVRFYRAANTFSVEFEYIGVERHLDVHQVEFWLTCILRMSRFFTGRELVPTYVGFLHHREGPVAEMERYFGCALNFGAEKDRVAFDPQESELPNVTADPFLNRFLVEYYEEAIVFRQPRQSSLRTRVENVITARLPHGTSIISNVASDLGMSARTLSRRLAEEGLTFSTILDELRSDLAKQYLRNTDLSISQIAWLLGYTEVSSFAHAFQRWTGGSPTKARRQSSQPSEAQEKQSPRIR